MHSLSVCTGHQAAGRAPSRGKPCGFVCKNASAAEAVCLSLGVGNNLLVSIGFTEH